MILSAQAVPVSRNGYFHDRKSVVESGFQTESFHNMIMDFLVLSSIEFMSGLEHSLSHELKDHWRVVFQDRLHHHLNR